MLAQRINVGSLNPLLLLVYLYCAVELSAVILTNFSLLKYAKELKKF